VLFVVANCFPILSFEMRGRITQTTLVSGVVDLYRQGREAIAVLVCFTIVLAPLCQIGLLLWVLLPLHLGLVPWRLPHAFRFLRHIQPWSMMEVFIIGILVAIVKLMGMATIIPGLALWAFVLLMLALAGAVSSFEPEAVWERLESWKRREGLHWRLEPRDCHLPRALPRLWAAPAGFPGARHGARCATRRAPPRKPASLHAPGRSDRRGGLLHPRSALPMMVTSFGQALRPTAYWPRWRWRPSSSRVSSCQCSAVSSPPADSVRRST
jgi:paraquat-inducible protein A